MNIPAEQVDAADLDVNEMADVLHRSSLPEQLPSLSGVRLAARYRPGGGGTIGGDWYDAFLLNDGRLVLVVGDVAGHGIPAAAAMGQLRNGMRAYIVDDPSPSRSLMRLNCLALQLLPTEMATAIVAVVDPSSRSVDIAMAGHLPPLLIAGDSPGSASFPTVARVPALGLSGADAVAPEPTVVDVPAGALLLFFTDGLIEQRGESIDAGLDRLRSLVASGPSDPESLCDLALTLMSDDPDPDADDVAVLAMQMG